MKQLKLILTALTAIFAAFGRLFAFRAVRGGGNFNFGRAFGAVCLSAILAIGNVAFAANAPFANDERHTTHATDWRIDIAYKYNPRDWVEDLRSSVLNKKRGPDGWTYLHEMAARNDTGQMGELIRSGGDTEVRTTTGRWTVLHIAASKGHKDAILLLLRQPSHRRARIDAWDQERKTPLHLAAQNGHYYAVKALTENRANVAAQDNKGRTPLHLAAQTDADYSKRLRPIPPFGLMEWLIAVKRADKNGRDYEGRTPLHLAAQADKTRAVKFLLHNMKADKNVKDKKGRTALHLAVDAGSTFAAKMLVDEFKMDASFVNKKNKDKENMTPLHLAAKNNGVAVKTLLALGAKTEVKDDRGYTPLHWAARTNDLEAVKSLVAYDANVLAKTNQKNYRATPLHFAAKYNAVDAAKYLIKAGATPVIYDSARETPESIAYKNHGESSEIWQLLRDAAREMRCKGHPGLCRK
ncbi:MAG: ankyrin repeat domain-containing protein [Gammaproteobacteria bacterium]